MAWRSWHLSLRRLPAPVVDAGLAVALAIAICVAISVTPDQGDPPDARAYGLGLLIAALSLLRRRWPLAVLLASAAILQFYNLFPYPGLFSAVPLSVALATAWAAGRRGWTLAVVAWFGSTPLIFLAVADLPEETRTQLVRGAVRPGPAGRGAAAGGDGAEPPGPGRRPPAAPGRAGAVRAAAAQRPPGSDRGPAQAGRGGHRRRLRRGHRPLRRPGRLHPAQPGDDPRPGRAAARRAVHGPRPAGRTARAGEDQDRR